MIKYYTSSESIIVLQKNGDTIDKTNQHIKSECRN